MLYMILNTFLANKDILIYVICAVLAIAVLFFFFTDSKQNKFIAGVVAILAVLGFFVTRRGSEAILDAKDEKLVKDIEEKRKEIELIDKKIEANKVEKQQVVEESKQEAIKVEQDIKTIDENADNQIKELHENGLTEKEADDILDGIISNYKRDNASGKSDSGSSS